MHVISGSAYLFHKVAATLCWRAQARAFDVCAKPPHTWDSPLSHPALQQPHMLSGVWFRDTGVGLHYSCVCVCVISNKNISIMTLLQFSHTQEQL